MANKINSFTQLRSLQSLHRVPRQGTKNVYGVLAAQSPYGYMTARASSVSTYSYLNICITVKLRILNNSGRVYILQLLQIAYKVTWLLLLLLLLMIFTCRALQVSILDYIIARYSHILIGSHLCSIRGQTRWHHHYKVFRVSYIKQIDSMLPCICSVTDHRGCQNVVRTSVTHSAITLCTTFLILPHFDIICDLLLNRCNLLILLNPTAANVVQIMLSLFHRQIYWLQQFQDKKFTY